MVVGPKYSPLLPEMAASEKVVVALSGGVDSAVSALLLAQRGYSVVGLTFRFYQCLGEVAGTCCTTLDREDARNVCRTLGIPHITVDASALFEQHVITPFVDDYLRGLTPSPCIRCNAFVKFPVLAEYANALGARWIATGHHARVVRTETLALLRAADPEKDQSYFLYSIGLEILERLLLPVGDMTKSEVRRIARAHGLPVSDKPDSQEVCFVSSEGRVAFIEKRAGARLPGPGIFVDMQGRVIGRHPGVHVFTVGQRKGLGLGGGPKRYVVKINPDANTVVLGSEKDIFSKEFLASDLKFLDQTFFKRLEDGCECKALVQVRSRHRAAPAIVTLAGDKGVCVRFEEPQAAICPGQAAVFYEGERVLGGGIIQRS